MTKISAFSDPPFSFSTITPQICVNKLKFWYKVKMLVVLHHSQKEWTFSDQRWACNIFLLVLTSKMSIGMAWRIVHCLGNVKCLFKRFSQVEPIWMKPFSDDNECEHNIDAKWKFEIQQNFVQMEERDCSSEILQI